MLYLLYAKWKYEDEPSLVGVFDSNEQVTDAKITYRQAYDDYIRNQITFLIDEIKLNEVRI